MPIEILNPVAPDQIVATCGETSVSDLDDHVGREEIFGPFLSAIAHVPVDEAASVENDITFGYSSCLNSEFAGLVERIVAEGESGMLHVNTGEVPEIQLSLVGVMDSTVGVGGLYGPAIIRFDAIEHPVDRRASV